MKRLFTYRFRCLHLVSIFLNRSRASTSNRPKQVKSVLIVDFTLFASGAVCDYIETWLICCNDHSVEKFDRNGAKECPLSYMT